jgi:hypothetical protein
MLDSRTPCPAISFSQSCSGETLEPGAIKLRESFHNERWITGEFEDRVRHAPPRALEVSIGAISGELPSRPLIMKPAPQDQPTLLHGGDLNKAAEVFPGVRGEIPLMFHHCQEIQV